MIIPTLAGMYSYSAENLLQKSLALEGSFVDWFIRQSTLMRVFGRGLRLGHLGVITLLRSHERDGPSHVKVCF